MSEFVERRLPLPHWGKSVLHFSGNQIFLDKFWPFWPSFSQNRQNNTNWRVWISGKLYYRLAPLCLLQQPHLKAIVNFSCIQGLTHKRGQLGPPFSCLPYRVIPLLDKVQMAFHISCHLSWLEMHRTLCATRHRNDRIFGINRRLFWFLVPQCTKESVMLEKCTGFRGKNMI